MPFNVECLKDNLRRMTTLTKTIEDSGKDNLVIFEEVCLANLGKKVLMIKLARCIWPPLSLTEAKMLVELITGVKV